MTTSRQGTSPCFIDGRVSHNSYLVVATKPDVKEYNAIGIRKLADDVFRWHCHPNWEFFGMEIPLMAASEYQRGTSYHSSILSKEHTDALLLQLQSKRGIVTPPVETFLLHPIMSRGFNLDTDATEQ